jgi:hypothetical protein
MPSAVGSSAPGSLHQAAGKRGLKDNVHLAEIINVTKLQTVLEEDTVFANALITQL